MRLHVSEETSLDIVAILIVLAVVMLTLALKPEETIEVEPVFIEEGVDVGALEETISTFDLDIDDLIDNPFVLDPEVIMGPAEIVEECVDTYLLSDISCDDKAAVVKFRKALAEIERAKLKKEIEESQRLILEKEYGLREC